MLSFLFTYHLKVILKYLRCHLQLSATVSRFEQTTCDMPAIPSSDGHLHIVCQIQKRHRPSYQPMRHFGFQQYKKSRKSMHCAVALNPYYVKDFLLTKMFMTQKTYQFILLAVTSRLLIISWISSIISYTVLDIVPISNLQRTASNSTSLLHSSILCTRSVN